MCLKEMEKKLFKSECQFCMQNPSKVLNSTSNFSNADLKLIKCSSLSILKETEPSFLEYIRKSVLISSCMETRKIQLQIVALTSLIGYDYGKIVKQTNFSVDARDIFDLICLAQVNLQKGNLHIGKQINFPISILYTCANKEPFCGKYIALRLLEGSKIENVKMDSPKTNFYKECEILRLHSLVNEFNEIKDKIKENPKEILAFIKKLNSETKEIQDRYSVYEHNIICYNGIEAYFKTALNLFNKTIEILEQIPFEERVAEISKMIGNGNYDFYSLIILVDIASAFSDKNPNIRLRHIRKMLSDPSFGLKECQQSIIDRRFINYIFIYPKQQRAFLEDTTTNTYKISKEISSLFGELYRSLEISIVELAKEKNEPAMAAAADAIFDADECIAKFKLRKLIPLRPAEAEKSERKVFDAARLAASNLLFEAKDFVCGCGHNGKSKECPNCPGSVICEFCQNCPICGEKLF